MLSAIAMLVLTTLVLAAVGYLVTPAADRGHDAERLGTYVGRGWTAVTHSMQGWLDHIVYPSH